MNQKSIINLVHIIFVFPLLFYIGYENGINKKPLNDKFAYGVIALSCLILIYHFYLFLLKNGVF